MALSKDLREFLELLNSGGVDYVIVGAHSLAFHGRPRYTGDLDILLRSTPEQASKIIDLLKELGFSGIDFKPADFIEPERVIQLGREPNRIDLLTGISDVTNEEAFSSKGPGPT
ncbi:MAG TPA: hypothetical protein VGM62_08740 [Chthoniobacterales bacterium]|jgi:hypothetical protein